MKILWLEQMTKEGSISVAARDYIYTDCRALLKVAISKAEAQTLATQRAGEWFDKHKGAVTAATTMAAMGTLGIVGPFLKNKFFGSRQTVAIQKGIDSSKASLMSHPDFEPHKEKVNARFNELVKLAPSVAGNPDLSFRILKEKLHSGFTSQDVQSLAQIQATYTPNMPAQMKMTQSIKVSSERRVGESLAAVVTLCKEAGVTGGTLSKVIENTLALSAISVLGGVGHAAAQHLMNKNEKKKMEAALTASFEAAVRNSPPEVAGNQEKSRQLFQILAHFSPHVAMQPEAARSFMSRMIQYDNTGRGAVQVEDIKNLSDIQRNYAQGGHSPSFFDNIAAGSKALGLDNAMKSGIHGIGSAMSAEVEGFARSDLGLPHNIKHQRAEG